MIKILIVDDMPIFREYLKTAIDWKTYGFEVVGEASNGQIALEMAAKLYPDIILADITMPYMDGLTLSQRILEDYSDTSIVLISGNADFSYAQKALRLGVSDYILKPFEKEELILTLLKIQDNIQKSMEIIEAEKLQNQKDQSSYLRLLIYGRNNTNDTKITKELSALDINLLSNHYMVITYDIERIGISNDKQAWRQNLKKLITSQLDDEIDFYVFDDYEGRIVTVHNIPNAFIVDEIKDSIEDLIPIVSKAIDYNFTVGLGTVHKTFAGIRQSYLESLNALNARHELGQNRLIEFNSTSEESKRFSFYSSEVNENLLTALKTGSWTRIEEELNETFDQIKKMTMSNEYIHLMYMGLLSLLLSHIVQSAKDIDVILGEDFDPSKRIKTTLSHESQQTFIKESFYKTNTFIKNHKLSKSEKIARDTSNYINENFMNSSLSIDMIAKSQLINQTYLRTMFKSEMNMTISDFITKVRMERAYQLIKENSLKLSAISEAVGYNDSSYFSKCFKKYYGVSPKKMRD